MQVLISTRADRSFEFVVNSPRTTWFLKRAAGIAKGANFPKRETCGRLSVKALYEIAKVKQADANLKDLPLEKICRSIVGVGEEQSTASRSTTRATCSPGDARPCKVS